MKKFPLIILINFFAVLFFSCREPEPLPPPSGRTFWATNFTTEKNYLIKAELLAEGTYCNVWVEKDSGVDEAAAKGIADEYDNNIYQKMINTFSFIDEIYYGIKFNNVMQFADFLGDEDGKLCILLLDIKDGYQKGVKDSYVAGYFWAGDLYFSSYYDRYSNKCDMIYIDTYPGVPGSKESNRALAHEMQHLMNFVSS